MSMYEQLVERVRRITNLEEAEGLLRWDQEVMMPDAGIRARAQQLSVLSRLHHDMLTAEKTGRLLGEMDEADLDDQQQAVVREVRRQYERAAAVPADIVEEISAASSEATDAWEAAREADDWDRFAPHLERLLELKRRYAEHIDPDRDAYAVLFEEYEPYLPLSTAETVLEELRDGLVPLIDDIAAADADLATDTFHGSFGVEGQRTLSEALLELLGWPADRGRLDTSAHPFTRGNQFDARITTRYDEDDVLSGVTSLVHEYGHALYALGLPPSQYGTPLGRAREMVVHESQSRFWENHVARSEPFWERVLPLVTDRFPGLDASPRSAFEAVNQVHDDNPIRVEADELTYHLHIVVRFELEQELLSGELSVADVPAAWDDRYDRYLGVRPETDAKGCLQDIHWSHGSFGYFPTYSLGSVLAAQLDAAVRDDLDVDGLVRDGSFGPVREWLQKHIHRHGQRFTTPELVERATGADLSTEPFLDYVRDKYGDLYGL